MQNYRPPRARSLTSEEFTEEEDWEDEDEPLYDDDEEDSLITPDDSCSQEQPSGSLQHRRKATRQHRPKPQRLLPGTAVGIEYPRAGDDTAPTQGILKPPHDALMSGAARPAAAAGVVAPRLERPTRTNRVESHGGPPPSVRFRDNPAESVSYTPPALLSPDTDQGQTMYPPYGPWRPPPPAPLHIHGPAAYAYRPAPPMSYNDTFHDPDRVDVDHLLQDDGNHRSSYMRPSTWDSSDYFTKRRRASDYARPTKPLYETVPYDYYNYYASPFAPSNGASKYGGDRPSAESYPQEGYWTNPSVPWSGWATAAAPPPPPTEVGDSHISSLKAELSKIRKENEAFKKQMADYKVSAEREEHLNQAKRTAELTRHEREAVSWKRLNEENRAKEWHRYKAKLAQAERDTLLRFEKKLAIKDRKSRMEEENKLRLEHEIRDKIEAEIKLEQERKKAEEEQRLQMERDIRERLLEEKRAEDELRRRDEIRTREIERRFELESQQRQLLTFHQRNNVSETRLKNEINEIAKMTKIAEMMYAMNGLKYGGRLPRKQRRITEMTSDSLSSSDECTDEDQYDVSEEPSDGLRQHTPHRSGSTIAGHPDEITGRPAKQYNARRTSFQARTKPTKLLGHPQSTQNNTLNTDKVNTLFRLDDPQSDISPNDQKYPPKQQPRPRACQAGNEAPCNSPLSISPCINSPNTIVEHDASHLTRQATKGKRVARRNSGLSSDILSDGDQHPIGYREKDASSEHRTFGTAASVPHRAEHMLPRDSSIRAGDEDDDANPRNALTDWNAANYEHNQGLMSTGLQLRVDTAAKAHKLPSEPRRKKAPKRRTEIVKNGMNKENSPKNDEAIQEDKIKLPPPGETAAAVAEHQLNTLIVPQSKEVATTETVIRTSRAYKSPTMRDVPDQEIHQPVPQQGSQALQKLAAAAHLLERGTDDSKAWKKSRRMREIRREKKEVQLLTNPPEISMEEADSDVSVADPTSMVHIRFVPSPPTIDAELHWPRTQDSQEEFDDCDNNGVWDGEMSRRDSRRLQSGSGDGVQGLLQAGATVEQIEPKGRSLVKADQIPTGRKLKRQQKFSFEKINGIN